jgi:hypothetical protein
MEPAQSAAAPVRLDVFQLALAVFGLTLYLGPPLLVLGYFTGRLFG